MGSSVGAECNAGAWTAFLTLTGSDAQLLDSAIIAALVPLDARNPGLSPVGA